MLQRWKETFIRKTKEGILIAKAKGTYKGRQLNTIETISTTVLSKYNQSHFRINKDEIIQ
jgi:hypothetical protein